MTSNVKNYFNHPDSNGDNNLIINGTLSVGTSGQILNGINTIVNGLDYGLVLDGSTNDFTALSNAATAANASGKTLVINAGEVRCKITGSENITFRTNCDFSGVIFDVSEYTGTFNFYGTKTSVNYPSGHAVVTAFEGSSDLAAGSSNISGWDGVTEVENAFIKINTDQDFYKYREVTQKRVDFNISLKEGRLAYPFKYSIDSVTINSIDVLPLEDYRRKVVGLVMDVGSNNSNSLFVNVSTTRLDIEVFFLASDDFTASNPTFIQLSSCADCTIKGGAFNPNISTNGSGYTYILSMYNCIDITLDSFGAQGDGWGATGSGSCMNIKFNNCKLNRIDFHRPIAGYLDVTNSVVGDWGVLCGSIGTRILIDNVMFIQSTMINVNNSGIFRNRGDGAIFCDCDLIMKDVRIVSDAGTTNIELIEHKQNSGEDNSKPIGSPINYRFFKHITIDGVALEDNGNSTLKIRPTNTNNSTETITFCQSLSISNTYGNIELLCELTGKTPSLTTEEFNFYLTVNNCTFSKIICTYPFNSAAIKILTNFSNVKPYSGDSLRAEINTNGVYTMSGCHVHKVDFFSGGTVVAPNNIQLQMYGCIIKDITPSDTEAIFNGISSACHVTLNGCAIDANLASRFNTVAQAKLQNCKLSVSGTAHTYEVAPAPTTGTYTLTTNVLAGQEIILNSATSHTYRFKMPAVGETEVVLGDNGSGTLVLGSLARTTTTSITASGSIDFDTMDLVP